MILRTKRITSNNSDEIYELNHKIFDGQIIYSIEYIEKICSNNNGYISYIDNEPIGYVFCDISYNHIVQKNVATMMSIGVLEKYRNLKIGKHLTEKICKNIGNDVYLYVREENHGAIQMYKNVGFIEIGKIFNYYKFKTGDENAVAMKKNMNDIIN